ncbi:hypothetical protein YK48G_06960 [Lentilactobacillus fungorum]|uniref:Uncharacterized protein n=1 Tax=Lentilactobacillus fungorum TaxID=2201250 RepID=A0ABQ3VZ36_9LACO|nr:DUF6612 family protein [Lentilactobacillus fungorum]GHP13271.1 hypothetical protein YK48G_06960 [Lentilactobacillus fungorum]
MKRLVMISVAALSLIMVGCSSQKANSQPGAAEVAQKAAQKVTTIKSGEANLVIKTRQKSKVTTGLVSGRFHLDPMIMKVTVGNGSKLVDHYYFDQNEMYMKSENRWYKGKVSQSSQLTKQLKRQLTASENANILKQLKDELKLKRSKTTATLSFKGTNPIGVKAAKQIIVSEAGSQAKKALKHVRITHFDYQYTLDKQTYLPKKVVISMKYRNSQTKKAINEKVVGTYKKLNHVKKFTVPEKIKKNVVAF